MDQNKIGKFLAESRKKQKMTQQELAHQIGVTDKAISKWENGRCLMDISLLKPLSEILNVSIVELINGETITEDNVYIKSGEVIENTLNYAQEKIKKNKIRIVSIIILVMFVTLILVFGIYKGIMLNKYTANLNDNYKEVVNGLSMDKTMKIYKKTINESNYLVEDDIKIRNDVSNFKRIDLNSELDSVKYLLYNDKNEVESSIWIGNMKSYIDIFTSDSLILFDDQDSGQFNSADRKYFLLKNDINNDLDLLKYIKNNYYIKNTLFTDIRNMKENYAFNKFVSITFPIVDSTTIISGDYSGYIFNMKKNVRTVHILRNDKSYIFTFFGEQFTTDNYIQDLLSTLEIK